MVNTAQCAYLPFGGTGLLVIQISLIIILYTSDDSFKIHSCAREKGQQRMWSAPGPFALADKTSHLVIQGNSKNFHAELSIKMRIKTNLPSFVQ